MSEGPLEPGQPVILHNSSTQHVLRVPEPGAMVNVEDVGVLAGDLFAGKHVGDRLEMGSRSFVVLEPTPQRVFETLHRDAQVIRPQDAARIAHLIGIGPGASVVEGGVGSGAMTAYLAHLVGDEGRVLAVDNREDHMGTARENVERAGLAGPVEWVHDRIENVDASADAFVADVPQAEAAAEAARACLRPGGRAAVYNPLVEQVASARSRFEASYFTAVRTVEVLERDWEAHGKGTRPSFDMLGHTGFITVATRVASESD
jgi:tRNA (adenine57-N1/adenine58-N1)-methyltransferase